MIFPDRCSFMIGATALTVPNRFIPTHKLEQRGIEVAGLGIHRPAATAARIGDQDIDAAPSLDDTGNHSRDRLVVRDIDFDPDRGAAHRLDLRDRAVAGHILRLGLELLVRVQVEIGDSDLGAEPGEPLRICPAETSCSASDYRHLAVQLAH